MKVLVLATAIVALLGPAGGATRWVENSGAPPRVGIFLDFKDNTSDRTVRAMQREVAAVLSATGAELSWLALNRDSQSETFDELAVLRFEGACDASRDIGAAGSAVALGSTELNEGEVSPYTTVHCDQVLRCLRSALDGEAASVRDGLFARALGRVVAHELYHILAKTKEHTHTGVTAALQTPYDLLRDRCRLDRKALIALGQRLRLKKSGGQLSARS
jgi:hypothetical protein